MKITPLHDSHAIESVTFAVEWLQPLPPNVMATLETVYEATLKSVLPSKKPIQHLALQFGGTDGAPVQRSHAAGWVFELFQPDGQVAHSLQLAPNFLAVTSFVYERWEQAFEHALAFMRPLLPLICVSTGGITVFGLQYADTFNIDSQDSTFSPDLLLNRQSTLLPASVFGKTSLWHAHHGYFSSTGVEPKHRCLTTVNVDLLDVNGALQLRILGAHRSIFDIPLLDVDPLHSGGAGSMQAAMHAMHLENKALLRDLLNTDTLRQIGLYEPNQPGLAS
ncbi:MAG: hypothetical protein AUK51_15435 [Comamonadaceae bacterium CG2_30_59_20]|nr:MAG: hypothetical protein AUK51_15435 [Comamonadaceae bacterium CG2_30_59_20]